MYLFIYFNPIFCATFLSYIFSNKFNIFYFTIIFFSDHRYFSVFLLDIHISLSWYFFIMPIFNCFIIILLWVFETLPVWNCTSNFFTNQITSCIHCFLNYSFWSSFKYISIKFFSMINKFLAVFTIQVFTYIFTIIFIRSLDWNEKCINLCLLHFNC